MPLKTLSNRPKAKQTPPVTQWQFEAIGTHWWIGIYQPADAALLQNLKADISARIDVFDKTYSRFRADSLVSRIAKQSGKYQFPADAPVLFDFYRSLYNATEGLVTPLIGRALADAGYDASYSLKPKAITTTPDWDDVMEVRGAVLIAKQPVLLDFGAAGKGYLADIVANILRQHNITHFCVDASGDMVCQGFGGQPLRIGMEHPDNSSQAIGVVQMADGALCGSAGNRRQWAQYNHIMDPKKRCSPAHVKAVWVTAPTAREADGLTTALYFASAQKLRSLFTFEYAMMYKNGELHRSPAFSAEIFTR